MMSAEKPEWQRQSRDTALKSAFVYTFPLPSLPGWGRWEQYAHGQALQALHRLSQHKGCAHAHASRGYVPSHNGETSACLAVMPQRSGHLFLYLFRICTRISLIKQLYYEVLKMGSRVWGRGKKPLRLNKFEEFSEQWEGFCFALFVCFEKKAPRQQIEPEQVSLSMERPFLFFWV